MMIGFTLTAGTIMATLSGTAGGARVDMTQYPLAIRRAERNAPPTEDAGGGATAAAPAILRWTHHE